MTHRFGVLCPVSCVLNECKEAFVELLGLLHSPFTSVVCGVRTIGVVF